MSLIEIFGTFWLCFLREMVWTHHHLTTLLHIVRTISQCSNIFNSSWEKGTWIDETCEQVKLHALAQDKRLPLKCTSSGSELLLWHIAPNMATQVPSKRRSCNNDAHQPPRSCRHAWRHARTNPLVYKAHLKDYYILDHFPPRNYLHWHPYDRFPSSSKLVMALRSREPLARPIRTKMLNNFRLICHPNWFSSRSPHSGSSQLQRPDMKFFYQNCKF